MQKETADLYSYRIAFRKALQVGRVSRVLKEYAIDCNLNHDAIVIAGQDAVRQIDSQRRERVAVNINDMPFTAVCDWTECPYDCKPKIEVSPIMVPAPGRSKDFQDRKDICFVGGFRHIPNVDAVLFFVKEVWPLVRKTLPEATFKIIGAEAPEEIVSLASDSVQILGHVQDLSTIFDSIKLSVAPIRYGAGVKGKVVLSMGLGVPVAGTPLAFEGMDLDLGKEALSGATPEELAMQIARLYTDSALWTTVSNAAVARAKREYSEEVNLPLIRGYLKAVGLSPREDTVGNLLGRVERQGEVRS
jgi:glycosyltransferase involved in cell wall biosynthesis